MALNFPPGVSTLGTQKSVFVPAIAAATGIPTVDELTGMAALEVSCYQFAPGIEVSATVNRETARRACQTEEYAITTSTQWAFTALSYVWDPQEVHTDSNAAYEALAEGTEGFLVIRYGLPAETDWTAGDVVHVFPIRTSAAVPDISQTEHRVTQEIDITGPVIKDVEVAA